ncbi:MAG: Rrf2 family transcriptional regulator [Alphaproteobacteria bacterium]
MKLGTKGRYAVMAMVDLARHMDTDRQRRPVTLADIAERQEISLSYLEQLFSKMRRAGLVKSVRGPGGGYVLARPAGELRISDIVLAVDEPLRTTRCAPDSGKGCMSEGSRCLTHDLWEELGNQIYRFLSGVTLEDVCARRVGGERSTPEGAVPAMAPSEAAQ